MLKRILTPLQTKSLLAFPPYYMFGLLKFKLPDLGERIKEGTIKKLYVQEGDQVTEF